MSTDPPLSTPSLWTVIRALFERMRRAVGEPACLAERAWIGPRERSDIRGWLSPLIAMARKLVLIEAIALARAPLAPPARQRKTQSLAKPKRAKPYALRLWPKSRRTGPRARQLGPPVLVRDIWRDNARAAAAHQLGKVRFMRPPPGVQFARRIEALERLLARPLAAARRLARKLRTLPKFALKLAAKKLPRTRRYREAEYAYSSERAFDVTFAWLYPNTS